LLAQYSFQLVEALAHPSGKIIVLVAGYLQKPPRYGNHLNRVERGDRPLQCFRFSSRIARHQLVAFPGQMQQSSAAFEYLQFFVLQERDLAKWLMRQMIGLATIEWDRTDCVDETRFLTRPPQP
jgi:hypothetical protein